MIKEEDVIQIQKNISPEHFETFEPDKQLNIIRRLESNLLHLKALEHEFPPKHMDELFQFIEHRLNDLQVIYNLKTNRKLDEFMK